MTHVFCFGLGYSAAALAARVTAKGWTVAGTSTSEEGCRHLADAGFAATRFDGAAPLADARRQLASASHVLVSAPPGEAGDPVLRWHASDLASAPNLRWIGYLSTVGVYGDRQGGWVDESSETAAVSERSRRRVAAEREWLSLAAATGKRVVIFRLAGIYGPGRSTLESLRAGTARRIVKPGQVFNRIHVADIATALELSMSGRGAHDIYNVTDDEPAPPQDVVAFAALLLGLEVPPAIPFPGPDLSPMALSFYGESKRVANKRLKDDLGMALAYPTYREGLRAILAG